MQLWQYCLLVTARSLYMFRTPTAVGNRPWTSLLDIYHPDRRHAPMTATTVSSTPDDGRRKRPKHVLLQLLINNTAKVASCWFLI